jgi:hypothetical protein
MSLNRQLLLVPLSGLCGFMLAVIMGVTPFSKAAPAPANQPQELRYQQFSEKNNLMLLETTTGKVWIAKANRAARDTDVLMEWRLHTEAPPPK